MTTVEVKKEDVFKAHKEANNKGKALLENLYPKLFTKDIVERVKTFQDICEVLGIDYNSFLDQIKDLPTDVAAYQKVRLIAQALNEGWKPNWNDSNERKWRPWFQFVPGSGFAFGVCGCVNACSDVGSRLCYKTEALAIYAAKQFKAEYQELFNY